MTLNESRLLSYPTIMTQNEAGLLSYQTKTTQNDTHFLENKPLFLQEVNNNFQQFNFAIQVFFLQFCDFYIKISIKVSENPATGNVFTRLSGLFKLTGK